CDPRVSVISYEDEFNFAKIHNAIVLDPGVGIVGAKLYFPDGKIQHAGVVLGLGAAAAHLFHRTDRVKIGPAAMLAASQDISAVTAACMLFRRSVFSELHGFDEAFAVDYNDVDFCLRAREHGYRVVWAADAELYHLECATRGTGHASEDPGQQA